MIMVGDIYIRSGQHAVTDFHTVYGRYHRMVTNLTIGAKHYLGSLRQINMGGRTQTCMVATLYFPPVNNFTVFSDIEPTTGMYVVASRIIEAQKLLYNLFYTHTKVI